VPEPSTHRGGITVGTLANVSRAIGLAQSIEHPVVKLPPGTRAVASEIVLLLQSVRDDLYGESDRGYEGPLEMTPEGPGPSTHVEFPRA
jgi:hypothetical protein